MPLTVLNLDHDPVDVQGEVVEGRPTVPAASLPVAIGWDLKPEGLCRGDVCVPVRDRASLGPGDSVDLLAVAAALGMQAVCDPEAGVVAIAPGAPALRQSIEQMQAPAFALPDLDGTTRSLDDFAGQKKMLLTFSSWCGCRYDLPAWNDLQRELADDGFTIIAIALDENEDDVRPFVPDDVAYPVLIDRDHVLTDKYGVINVPTVVWIDERDEIVKPADVAFGDNQFKDFHGVDADPHKDALRAWVRNDDRPVAADQRAALLRAPSEDEEEARLWFRVALHLRRRGDREAADRNFDRAIEKAPIEDFTIRRAAMPLRGQDPFGEPFMELYEEWGRLGRPYYPTAAEGS